jgi:hypothetical protein
MRVNPPRRGCLLKITPRAGVQGRVKLIAARIGHLQIDIDREPDSLFSGRYLDIQCSGPLISFLRTTDLFRSGSNVPVWSREISLRVLDGNAERAGDALSRAD